MPSLATFDLMAVHQAIVDALQNGGIETAYPCWVDSIDPPCVVVVGQPDGYIDLERAFRMGVVVLNVTLMMFGNAETREGQEQIMSWLSMGTGSPSVLEALRPMTGGVPDTTIGIAGASVVFGTTRYASAVFYPEGSNNRYALGELDLQITISTGG